MHGQTGVKGKCRFGLGLDSWIAFTRLSDLRKSGSLYHNTDRQNTKEVTVYAGKS